LTEVILMGEPMAMFIADDYGPLEKVKKFTRSMAGAEVNVCIGLTRIGHGCAYLTKLGTDPMGKYIFNRLKKENFDTRFVSLDDRFLTALQLKSKVKTGDPDVAYYRKGSAASHMSVEDVDKIDMTGVRHVHITGIPPALSLSCREATYRLIERAKENGIYTTFDPNLRPTLWESREVMIRVINDLASKCDLVLPGLNEGRILTNADSPEKISDFYQNIGVGTVIIKTGKQGAYVRTPKESYRVKTFPVPQEKIIDTVGAGDGFAVGIISGRLEGLSLLDSVIRGNAIGSIQVQNASDNEGLPTQHELDEFYQEYRDFQP
jgi:2-dehydro-3-deoxygluconokinase